MVERRFAGKWRTIACLVGSTFAAGGLGTPAWAAESVRPAAARPARPPAAESTPPASAPAVDAELLEFLGSDDVDPELQQYLANRAPARSGSEEK